MRSANLEMLQLSPIPYRINYLNKVFLTLNSYQLEAIAMCCIHSRKTNNIVR